ncbi:phospho-sugar mutase [Deltaproteobacteria bacterium TL4]
MDMTIEEKAKLWATDSYFDESTRKEVQALIAQQNTRELQERFGQMLEFGTGGLRGIMGAGINRMNRYTIRLATEGLARYIEKHATKGKIPWVVIGYDSRNHSLEFSKSAAEVLAAHGVSVYLFQTLAPTPLVSCEVIRKGAIAGIVVTASHNPPEYNGYKVYWKNGGQVIPPEDEDIIEEVRKVEQITSIPTIPFEKALNKGQIQWLTSESDQYFYEAVIKLALGKPENNQNLGVVYTPLHGTGGRLVPELLKRRGFKNFLMVPEQGKPDGNFSTIRSPNPEDPRALEMAVSVSSPEHDVILANDPDADRLGVMIRHPDQGWYRLNGNQIGALLLNFQLQQLQHQNKIPANGALVVSLVTSPLPSAIARSYGLQVVETLTGFKWIWAAAKEMERTGSGSFIFGMEESHGYLAGNHSGDKDGIWAAMAFAEMAASLKASGIRVWDFLQQIYDQFGFYLDALETITLPGLEGLEQIRSMMERFRRNPPQTLGGQPLVRVTDLQNNQVKHLAKNEITSGPNLSPSNVLIFELADQSRVIVRPSGTEPKIKFYFNLRGTEEQALQQQLAAIKKDMVPS